MIVHSKLVQDPEYKVLPWRQVIDSGYLQEANRRFFHPLGLVMGVQVNNDGSATVQVFDFRSDPDGVWVAHARVDCEQYRVRARDVSLELANRGDIVIVDHGVITEQIATWVQAVAGPRGIDLPVVHSPIET